MYPTSSNPALTALGDRLESATGDAISAGRDRPPRRRWLLAPLAAIAVLAVFGAVLVFPTDDDNTAAATVLSAADRTSAASTGRFELTAQASGLDGLAVSEVAVTVDGAFDIPADRYSASVDLASILGSLPAEALEGASVDDIGTFDVVVDGDVVYVRLGPVLSMFGSDAEWISVTTPGLTEGTEASPVPPLQDPAAFLDALNGAGADMVEAGREQVRGVETTHYEGTLSIAEALGSLDADEQADLEAALGGVLEQAAPIELPVGVWIDDEGYVRRVAISLDGASLGVPETAGASFSVTVEYFDLGEPVGIEPPAPDQVVDLDGFLAELEGALDGLELPSTDELLEGLEIPDLDLGELEDELEDGLDDLAPEDEEEDGGPPEAPTDPSTGEAPADAETVTD